MIIINFAVLDSKVTYYYVKNAKLFFAIDVTTKELLLIVCIFFFFYLIED